jgi:tetraacyldisaccharide 4'-kinase
MDSAIAFTNAKSRITMMYQHRKVKAIFYSLYGELYSDDFMLPTGNLRESRRKGYYCNKMSRPTQRQSGTVKTGWNCGNQKLFYNIEFDEFIYSEKRLEK